MAAHTSKDIPRTIRGVEWLFEGHRAPAFMLALLLLYKVLLVGMLLAPTSNTPFGQFAEDFKTWCFGYDPATGKLQVAQVVVMLAEPLALAGTIFAFWGSSIRTAFRSRPRVLLPSGLLALAVVLAGSAAFGSLRTTGEKKDELPFPAEALRTSFAAPRFSLEDQDGNLVALDAIRGKVVMVTGVYASCGTTCPTIFMQARRALATLTPEERAEVVVVAITLDPTHDDRARRSALAKGQQITAPLWHVVGGEAAAVETALDDFNFARKRDPNTGVIEHANLFVLIDRKGKVAYRFTLGERQEQWLATALRLLVKEH